MVVDTVEIVHDIVLSVLRVVDILHVVSELADHDHQKEKVAMKIVLLALKMEQDLVLHVERVGTEGIQEHVAVTQVIMHIHKDENKINPQKWGFIIFSNDSGGLVGSLHINWDYLSLRGILFRLLRAG